MTRRSEVTTKPRDGSDAVVRDMEKWLKHVCRLAKESLADSKKERDYFSAAAWEQAAFCYGRALEALKQFKRKAKKNGG